MDVVVENSGDFFGSGWPRYMVIHAELIDSLIKATQGSGAVFDVCAPIDIKLFLARFKTDEREFALTTLNEETWIALLNFKEFP